MNTDEQIVSIVQQFFQAIPHCRILKMEPEHASSEGVVIKMPFNEELEANPGSGIIHSGAITTLMDSAFGVAACVSLPGFETCPTIDLRIDHLGFPAPFKPVRCFAEAYRVTKTVVFTRGVVYQDNRNDPFAHGVGTFMRSGRTLSQMAKGLAK
ncbi:PaaI family thioesterase [Endozoicomonas sp. 8E]|uniref:PaaI family thioesterase n=1 Tax=Endozoicomonas sp. 8E TaxID=3035692 RepID=UPI002938D00F|nr:PaaI family thioesterase [Endozoicomonas sp. 8E]WOG25844.1 PaaI family thioesterase [Endozoicomonas sp. 8E]